MGWMLHLGPGRNPAWPDEARLLAARVLVPQGPLDLRHLPVLLVLLLLGPGAAAVAEAEVEALVPRDAPELPVLPPMARSVSSIALWLCRRRPPSNERSTGRGSGSPGARKRTWGAGSSPSSAAAFTTSPSKVRTIRISAGDMPAEKLGAGRCGRSAATAGPVRRHSPAWNKTAALRQLHLTAGMRRLGAPSVHPRRAFRDRESS